MRSLRALYNLYILILTASSLISCNVFNAYSRYPGVTYISSEGNLPAAILKWSPQNSNKILISATLGGYGRTQVYVFDIVTKRKTFLAETEHGDIEGNGWSPDGKFITLSIADATKEYSQPGSWILNTEDKSMKFYDKKDGAAVWSPDGKFIGLLTGELLSSKDPRGVSFYTIDIQTNAEEIIYTNDKAVSHSGVSLSPDGQKVVFSLVFYDGTIRTNDLYVLDLTSRKVIQLTNDGGSAFPAWSPKGNVIAYQKYNTVGGKNIFSLHLIHSDGGCDIDLPKLDYIFSPTWSPDGRQLAFIGPDGIYVIDLEKFLGRDIYQNLCQ